MVLGGVPVPIPVPVPSLPLFSGVTGGAQQFSPLAGSFGGVSGFSEVLIQIGEDTFRGSLGRAYAPASYPQPELFQGVLGTAQLLSGLPWEKRILVVYGLRPMRWMKEDRPPLKPPAE